MSICLTCGHQLRTVLDGEQWCDHCQTYRRYRRDGWSVAVADPEPPNPDEGVADCLHVAGVTANEWEYYHHELFSEEMLENLQNLNHTRCCLCGGHVGLRGSVYRCFTRDRDNPAIIGQTHWLCAQHVNRKREAA